MHSIFALLVLATAGFAQQPSPKPYAHFDGEKLLIAAIPDKSEGPKLNGTYLDMWIEELAVHARNYPVSFASEDDKKRAYRDAELLSKILDAMNETPEPNPELLRRAGFVNSMAHNLDVPGAAEKAIEYFTKLLKARPDDPMGNYMFGAFLGSAGKADASIPYLKRADELGVVDASYGLGMAYLMSGDKQNAIIYFEKYGKLVPEDKSIATLLEAIKSGRVEFRHMGEGK